MKFLEECFISKECGLIEIHSEGKPIKLYCNNDDTPDDDEKDDKMV